MSGPVIAFTDLRYDGRFSALVSRQSWGDGDPIPLLVTIFDAATGDKAAAFWRGDEADAEECLREWVDAWKGGDDD